MPKFFSMLTLATTVMVGAAFAQQAVTQNATDMVKDAAETTANTAADAAQTATDAAQDAANKVMDAATSETATDAAAADATNTATDAAAEGTTMDKPAATETAAPAAGQTDGQAPEQNAEAQATTPQQVEDPTYVKETYGDWELKCYRTEGQDDPCQMFQLLKEEAGNPIAEFSLFRLKNGGKAVAGATIVVPLGTLLTEDLKISVDGGRAKTFSYSFCSMVGCYARIGLTAEDVAAFKNGATAVLQIIPAQAPDQKVDIKASLNGFTAAFENSSFMN